MLNLSDRVVFTGRFRGWLVGPDGRLKAYVEAENKVVTVGLEHIADQLLDNPVQNPMSHYAIGTGTTAPAAGDTALQTEVSRVALQGKSRTNAKVTYSSVFGPGQGTGNISEGAIFNASSAGTMLARLTFTPITKGAGDTFIASHELTAAAAA